MQPKVVTWLFPTAILAILMLAFAPMGHPSTYGRITYTKYKFILGENGNDVIDYTRLGLQLLIVAVLAYCIAYVLANRPCKEKTAKEPQNNLKLSTGKYVGSIFPILLGLMIGSTCTAVVAGVYGGNDHISRQELNEVIDERENAKSKANEFIITSAEIRAELDSYILEEENAETDYKLKLDPRKITVSVNGRPRSVTFDNPPSRADILEAREYFLKEENPEAYSQYQVYSADIGGTEDKVKKRLLRGNRHRILTTGNAK